MSIPQGKKRYYLTLDQSNMEQFKAMLDQFGAPAHTESILINEFVTGMVKVIGPVLHSIKASGRDPSMADFFMLVANQMRSLEDEQLKL